MKENNIMIKRKIIEFAKEKVIDIEPELESLAIDIKNKSLNINTFWSTTLLHLLNYHLTRTDIISYLESKGFQENDDKVRLHFSQFWLVNKKTSIPLRKCESWEHIDGFKQVKEAELNIKPS